MQRTLQAALPDLEQELAGRVGVWVSDMFLQHEPLQSPAITTTQCKPAPPHAGGGMGGEQNAGKLVGETAGNLVGGAGEEQEGFEEQAGAAVAGAKLSSLSRNEKNEAADRVSKRRGNVSPLAVDLLVRKKQKETKEKDTDAACVLRQCVSDSFFF